MPKTIDQIQETLRELGTLNPPPTSRELYDEIRRINAEARELWLSNVEQKQCRPDSPMRPLSFLSSPIA